ncbi:MAG: hypothetical protein HY908_09380 [Myxococcales bacterium]|nr:hypothetical protein [Myxococcales bacterium]
MKEATARPLAVKVLLVSGLVGASALGCMRGGGDAAREFEAGLSAVRAGLSVVREGAARVEAGARVEGLGRVEVGLGDMMRGLEQMHAGVGMMVDGDTVGCCDGMVDHGMMARADGAMSMMSGAYADLSDGDPANDGDGSSELHAGMDSMEAGLGNADDLTSCGDMMGGGMR